MNSAFFGKNGLVLIKNAWKTTIKIHIMNFSPVVIYLLLLKLPRLPIFERNQSCSSLNFRDQCASNIKNRQGYGSGICNF